MCATGLPQVHYWLGVLGMSLVFCLVFAICLLPLLARPKTPK